MTQTPTDIRIIKTQKALAETLQELMKQKSFQKITVNDICQSAMVSRSTFYLHFEDKYQLLQFCLQGERQRLKEAVEECRPRQFLAQMLEAVKDRRLLYRSLIQGKTDQDLIQMFQSFSHGFFAELLQQCQQAGVTLAGPIPLLAAYYANGMAGLIIHWITNDFNVAVDELVDCLCNLMEGLWPDEACR